MRIVKSRSCADTPVPGVPELNTCEYAPSDARFRAESNNPLCIQGCWLASTVYLYDIQQSGNALRTARRPNTSENNNPTQLGGDVDSAFSAAVQFRKTVPRSRHDTSHLPIP